jgi:polar amino acid transport system substrate-binding protein
MGIRPDRNLKVNFSNPYYYSGVSMVAHKEQANGFKSVEDFNRPEVVVIARIGSTGVTAAKTYLPKAQLRLFDDESQGLQELLNGNAHAYIGDEPMPAFQVIKHPEKIFLPLKESLIRNPIGFAVRKGDVDTLNFLNNWILSLQAEGWLEERRHYWFETMDWESLLE